MSMRTEHSVDWRDPRAYDYTGMWDRAAWAWSFLRRNADYRREWTAFIATWRELEAAYGAPPARDMARWLADPRAYVQEPVSTAEGCIGADDRVMIECGLGARWGFYKFPPDPYAGEHAQPPDIAWRVVEPDSLAPLAPHSLQFDLALPLADQLAYARTALIAAQRGAQRDKDLLPPTLSAHRPHLLQCLRLLDGRAAGADPAALAAAPGMPRPEEMAALAAAADALIDGGYRRILLWHDA